MFCIRFRSFELAITLRILLLIPDFFSKLLLELGDLQCYKTQNTLTISYRTPRSSSPTQLCLSYHHLPIHLIVPRNDFSTVASADELDKLTSELIQSELGRELVLAGKRLECNL